MLRSKLCSTASQSQCPQQVDKNTSQFLTDNNNNTNRWIEKTQRVVDKPATTIITLLCNK